MIHYITPASVEKNLGQAINTLIDPMKDEDWVCLRDIDTMPLLDTLTFVRAIDQITRTTQHDIIGAMVNRQGLKYLLHEGQMSDNPDINQHVKIAQSRYDHYGTITVNTKFNETIAGAFMLFKVSTWRGVGGFPEGAIEMEYAKNGRTRKAMIDYIFCDTAQSKGYRLGYAPGIYLFHLYRWGSKDPRYVTRHLR